MVVEVIDNDMDHIPDRLFKPKKKLLIKILTIYDLIIIFRIFRMQRVLQNVGKVLVAGGTAFMGFNQIIYNVDAGCRGVIFDRFRGVLPDVTGEGKTP